MDIAERTCANFHHCINGKSFSKDFGKDFQNVNRIAKVKNMFLKMNFKKIFKMIFNNSIEFLSSGLSLCSSLLRNMHHLSGLFRDFGSGGRLVQILTSPKFADPASQRSELGEQSVRQRISELLDLLGMMQRRRSAAEDRSRRFQAPTTRG